MRDAAGEALRPERLPVRRGGKLHIMDTEFGERGAGAGAPCGELLESLCSCPGHIMGFDWFEILWIAWSAAFDHDHPFREQRAQPLRTQVWQR